MLLLEHDLFWLFHLAESDGYSFTSSLSRRSSSAHIRGFKSRPISGASTDLTSYSRPVTASPDRVAKSAFTPSHFPNIPPTVNFIAEGEKSRSP